MCVCHRCHAGQRGLSSALAVRRIYNNVIFHFMILPKRTRTRTWQGTATTMLPLFMTTLALVAELVLAASAGGSPVLSPSRAGCIIATATSANCRSCYGCIGYCTYGDNSCFVNNTYGEVPHALAWHDVDATLGTQGRGWASDSMGDSPYTRLPAKAHAIVDKTVWSLAQMSAGLKTRFSTAAKDVWVRLTRMRTCCVTRAMTHRRGNQCSRARCTFCSCSLLC